MLPFTETYAQQSAIKLVPQPADLQMHNGFVKIKDAISVFIDPRSGVSKLYAKELFQEIGIQPVWRNKEKDAVVVLKLTKSQVIDESYSLQISLKEKGAIIASSPSKNGLLNALQTIRQLAVKEDQQTGFPLCTINDKPRFGWRAYMLDESRHFHGKIVVKKLLDEMARLKLNTFHWHLVDDPGWRVEIKKYPRLTSVGSKGDHTHMSKGISPVKWDSLYNNRPGQFYTQADIREIVAYAIDRGIRIIPEIEVPGHASASIYAYPWLGASSRKKNEGIRGDLYDITDPKVVKFLQDVLDEIISLFPSKIIHIGGDEANYSHWKESKEINEFMKANNIPTYSDLQVWAINRMSKYISSKGYRMIGWNEITGDNIRNEAHVEAGKSEKLAKGTLVQFWDGDVSLVNKAIEKGYDVVNSDRLFTYLDYPYETTSFEKAYAFNPIPNGISAADSYKVLGLGCQMWGEFTPTSDRVYYQTFPRIAAFAETGWVAPEKKGNYLDFRNRLSQIEEIWKTKGYIKDQEGRY
ncbi:beta-N-acetylhexosaminidase [Pedobacter sp. B4-66]|uniref:beta-N-acetylhexosaminidase n=1 Tax=Pedobacter sp. B4-66 TaxID=2817280 RepID=UPI001BDACFBD|nr:beta-N-acetylhexosaminidase [Pedobacter sp. B4-66]